MYKDVLFFADQSLHLYGKVCWYKCWQQVMVLDGWVTFYELPNKVMEEWVWNEYINILLRSEEEMRRV